MQKKFFEIPESWYVPYLDSQSVKKNIYCIPLYFRAQQCSRFSTTDIFAPCYFRGNVPYAITTYSVIQYSRPLIFALHVKTAK